MGDPHDSLAVEVTMTAFFAFLIAFVLFLLATFGVAQVFTLATIPLGLTFVALGLLLGGAPAFIARFRAA